MSDEEILQAANSVDVKGTTVNERLFISGLMNEYDRAIVSDKAKARKILEALHVGYPAIDDILNTKGVQ